MNQIYLMFQRSCIILALTLVAACSTNVADLKPIPDEAFLVAGISVEGSLHSNATSEHVGALETAIRNEIASRVAGNHPVDLKVIVTRAEFVSQGTRAMVGMLAGSNHLDLKVYLLEPGTSNSIGEFEVKVNNNPGGFGMFTNPIASASDDAAKAIANKVFKS